MEFKTSYSGATFEVRGGALIKSCRNLYASGIMQLEHNTEIFKTPRVYALGEHEIVMDYLPNAVDLPTYLNNCSKTKTEEIAKRIIDYVDCNSKRTEVTRFKPDVVVGKINHIITRLTDFNDILLAKQLALAFSDSMLETIAGVYHGDLTFNNILVDGDSLYLIDFLPGYIPTPLLDIVKLRQEVHLNWSCYFVNAGENYYHAIDLLRPYVNDWYAGFEGRALRLMEALNYLRILPYASKDAIIAGVLRTEIKNILDDDNYTMLRGKSAL